MAINFHRLFKWLLIATKLPRRGSPPRSRSVSFINRVGEPIKEIAHARDAISRLLGATRYPRQRSYLEVATALSTVLSVFLSLFDDLPWGSTRRYRTMLVSFRDNWLPLCFDTQYYKSKYFWDTKKIIFKIFLFFNAALKMVEIKKF